MKFAVYETRISQGLPAHLKKNKGWLMQIVNFLFLFFFQYQRIKFESAQEKEGKNGYWEGKPWRFSVEITNWIICLAIVNKQIFENQVLTVQASTSDRQIANYK